MLSISIHSLHVEGDWRRQLNTKASKNFNPLPPCGGRPLSKWCMQSCFLISIHSLRVEGDGGRFNFVHDTCISIHSLRVEGDVDGVRDGKRQAISIHSLRVEGDATTTKYGTQTKNFNPLPPCGGRPSRAFIIPYQSRISIHSLRVEGDCRKLQIKLN